MAPGRNALCRVQQGLEKIYDKPGQVFNRIHAADIGRALYACWLCHHKDPGAPGSPGIFGLVTILWTATRVRLNR